MKNTKHSWPRRSGKTTSALNIADYLGLKYYSCGGRYVHVNSSATVTNLIGLKSAVIDNYERATKEELQIISRMTGCHIFGTFGSQADDWRCGNSEGFKWAKSLLDSGAISTDVFIRDFVNL